MPKLKPGTLLPTPEEDAAITAAAQADPDALPMTEAEWAEAKPKVRRGRRLAAVTKERITIRLSRDVVESFRASGEGWQTRVDSALKDWLKTHTPG
ncbi:BrnA antitoxin family protein [Zoogloea sp.]|uniref:BrnA antitoxin family protein n=1 Tax=Zoogloea sp. TaxID=49181 RepID=UPI00261F1347|nr:BrnA antitoxin family protein [uncultured Zoogloea sp.]